MLKLHNDEDLAFREKHAAEVDAPEPSADRVTGAATRQLLRTFAAPIDREQIHGLINSMDDIVIRGKTRPRRDRDAATV